MSNGVNFFELLVTNAVKLPGVKVNRAEFLVKSFSNKVNSPQLTEIFERGPIQANVSQEMVRRVAKKIVMDRTFKSTSASFVAGVPGGIAMAATVPADTAQFFGVALRLAQEIGYLYGYEDFWDGDQLDVERVSGDLILFLGVMFGVGGATATIKVLSSELSKQALTKIPNKALTKTIYYPILKKMGGYVGVKLTKKTFAQSVSKIIPIAGGVISGWITYSSMTQMGHRLVNALEDNIDVSYDEFVTSFEEMKRENPDIVDVDFLVLEGRV
ncbi:bacteriochlorophyll 4-vinyl reductase [Exiguobacterium sp. SH3S2]|uniref:bacteriochlorophyll 4-vinyl reductase n=1 Tax=unclassified Exiguobacterium TaxID=2644629 RepID=UPI00103EF049|nr:MULTISPECIES: bacteriochlorophyll 4-vinyl reductase [unclassified Exiguobacterium]TCI26478.1 bacteriochlorophyll 4-vinyl reductase [Exiguobacterium sp. SH5S4]TCI43403.1 bacteriochlorophyll 4-vinyl reductase [Exiguobacterium sp. SH3S3]TCI59249.1 bacteriochlorophyll 4-vinyl reductase [Exiguobacterium sp. SH3S2]TCI66407.1 bacteriochlorophyll 4-vinyl reductase [Exiguobacterium sp. SH3S1]